MSHDERSSRARLSAAGRRLVKRGLRRLGFHVQRYSPATAREALVEALLANQRIDLVLDVGANAGQYGRALRESGYQGQILSFEPLSDAWAQCAASVANDPNWTLAPRMALGARDGEVEIHIAKNSASSSLLPMREIHREAAPESAYVGREKVDLRRLDGVARDATTRASRVLLKIDTQGYEMEVLAGATGILDRIHGLQVEISLTPLYENSPSMIDVLRALEDRGFVPYAMLPEFVDPRSGRMLQVEGLFFREAPGSSARAIASSSQTSSS